MEEILAWVGVCKVSARRGVKGLSGEMRIAVSCCFGAERAALQPILFLKALPPEGDVGEMQVEDKLLISVLRGNSGEEGEGDLLLNMPVNVSRTEDDCGVEGGGERGSEIAASKRETELVEEAE